MSFPPKNVTFSVELLNSLGKIVASETVFALQFSVSSTLKSDLQKVYLTPIQYYNQNNLNYSENFFCFKNTHQPITSVIFFSSVQNFLFFLALAL